jgi:hypothetical protein
MPSTDTATGWVRHGPHCICHACRRHRRRLEREAQRRPVATVYSDAAAAHIRELRRKGWQQAQIAEAAGVSTGTVSAVKQPGVVINASMAEAILSSR